MKFYLCCMAFVAISFITSCSPKASNDAESAQVDTVNVERQHLEQGDRGYLVAVGDTAPVFQLDVDNGSKFSIADARGKVVMIQFTASWCGICRKEMPHIENEIWKRFGSNPDFVLMGVDREETPEKVKHLKEVTGVTYPIAYDVAGEAFRLYAYPDAGITRNVLIDRDGRIVMLTRKFQQAEFDTLCAKIASLLNVN